MRRSKLSENGCRGRLVDLLPDFTGPGKMRIIMVVVESPGKTLLLCQQVEHHALTPWL